MARYQKWKKKREGAGQVPTDSFSDIAFLLIVFFILTMTMTVSQGLETELPAGEKSAQESKVPTVAVYRDGTMEYNQNEMKDLEDLAEALAELDLPNRRPDDKVIQLEAINEPAWELYAQVWITITKAGGVVAMVETEEED